MRHLVPLLKLVGLTFLAVALIGIMLIVGLFSYTFDLLMNARHGIYHMIDRLLAAIRHRAVALAAQVQAREPGFNRYGMSGETVDYLERHAVQVDQNTWFVFDAEIVFEPVYRTEGLRDRTPPLTAADILALDGYNSPLRLHPAPYTYGDNFDKEVQRNRHAITDEQRSNCT